MLVSNDYLCIAADPSRVWARTECLEQAQAGMLMSSVFLQEGSRQHRLEARLAAIGLGRERPRVKKPEWLRWVVNR
jgi:CAI-1 autoinducer synthase